MNKETFQKFCHDLKNPLTVMKMNLDLVELEHKNKKADPKLRRFLKTMNKEISKMAKLLSKKK